MYIIEIIRPCMRMVFGFHWRQRRINLGVIVAIARDLGQYIKSKSILDLTQKKGAIIWIPHQNPLISECGAGHSSGRLGCCVSTAGHCCSGLSQCLSLKKIKGMESELERLNNRVRILKMKNQS
jgi:hypothetical protein